MAVRKGEGSRFSLDILNNAMHCDKEQERRRSPVEENRECVLDIWDPKTVNKSVASVELVRHQPGVVEVR